MTSNRNVTCVKVFKRYSDLCAQEYTGEERRVDGVYTGSESEVEQYPFVPNCEGISFDWMTMRKLPAPKDKRGYGSLYPTYEVK